MNSLVKEMSNKVKVIREVTFFNTRQTGAESFENNGAETKQALTIWTMGGNPNGFVCPCCNQQPLESHSAFLP